MALILFMTSNVFWASRVFLASMSLVMHFASNRLLAYFFNKIQPDNILQSEPSNTNCFYKLQEWMRKQNSLFIHNLEIKKDRKMNQVDDDHLETLHGVESHHYSRHKHKGHCNVRNNSFMSFVKVISFNTYNITCCFGRIRMFN